MIIINNNNVKFFIVPGMGWKMQDENKADLIPVPFGEHQNKNTDGKTPYKDTQIANPQPKPIF